MLKSGKSKCVKFKNCKECADRIYEWIDGEITDAMLKRVQEQIDYCKGCTGVYEFEQMLKELYKRNLHEKMPERLKNRILTAIRDK